MHKRNMTYDQCSGLAKSLTVDQSDRTAAAKGAGNIGDVNDYTVSLSKSLISKHNGWITVDQENGSRKEAPEIYKTSHPLQKNRLKPTFMNIPLNQSLEI